LELDSYHSQVIHQIVNTGSVNNLPLSMNAIQYRFIIVSCECFFLHLFMQTSPQIEMLD
jgi:hypothetical protein